MHLPKYTFTCLVENRSPNHLTLFNTDTNQLIMHLIEITDTMVFFGLSSLNKSSCSESIRAKLLEAK